jgi:hypothetical protein
MSALLDQLAGRARLAECDANDAALGIVPTVLRVFGVTIRAGKSIRSEFEAMGVDPDRMEGQLKCLLADGETLVVRAMEVA